MTKPQRTKNGQPLEPSDHPSPTPVTKEKISMGLRELGLPPGATVLVHSSLKSFGYVEGGADAVVEALLETVGPEGTVMVPTLPFRGSQYVYMRSRPTFNVAVTPSKMGAITEALRRRPEAKRSLHPSHAVAAVGPLSDYMLRAHEKAPTSCGLGTPYHRNIQVGGYILLLGVTNRSNTTLHTLEEMEDPNLFSDETFEATTIDYNGTAHTVSCRPYAWGGTRPRNFDRVDGDLIGAGVMKKGRIGEADVRLIEAQGMADVVRRRMQEDTRYLLQPAASAGEERVADADALRRGVVEALWPGQPPRRKGQGILGNRVEDDDVVLEDLRLLSPQNPLEVIPALMARPRQMTGPLPGVVCLHGTSRDRHFLMEKEYFFEREQARLHGWARELARRGFVTLAISQRGHGGRLNPDKEGRDRWVKGAQAEGRTAMGDLVEDALTGVDYLLSRSDVVSGEIGAVGFSLGGIVSFYSSVVDPRIGACVPVCGGVGSMRALIDHGATTYHSAYYYVPRILTVGDHIDFLHAVAPRPLLLIGAKDDVGMPIAAVERLQREGREVYAGAGNEEGLGLHVEPGGHNFSPLGLDAMSSWLGVHLK